MLIFKARTYRQKERDFRRERSPLVRSWQRAIQAVLLQLADVDPPSLKDAFKSGNVGAVESVFDWDLFAALGQEVFLNLAFDSLTAGTRVAARFVPQYVAAVNEAAVAEAATRWAEESMRDVMLGVERQTRLAVREHAKRMLAEGWDPDEAADELIRIAGLDVRYADAMARLRFTMEQAGMSQLAVRRRLDQYRRQSLIARAYRLAFTETTRATNHAERLLWDQAILEGRVEAHHVWKTWRIFSDEPCPICETLDGESVRIWESFATLVELAGGAARGFHADEPPLHPHCPCFLTYSRRTR